MKTFLSDNSTANQSTVRTLDLREGVEGRRNVNVGKLRASEADDGTGVRARSLLRLSVARCA